MTSVNPGYLIAAHSEVKVIAAVLRGKMGTSGLRNVEMSAWPCFVQTNRGNFELTRALKPAEQKSATLSFAIRFARCHVIRKELSDGRSRPI